MKIIKKIYKRLKQRTICKSRMNMFFIMELLCGFAKKRDFLPEFSICICHIIISG